ncbi:MAG: AAA family ATPase [Candidatus Omnitrophica bacterium]|nr:AAA family ATPase [Candidatus Omnitrophota bacterium]
MYLDYWGLNEKPFENTPDPRFVFYSPAHEEAYARLSYVISQHKGAAMLTGEYGAGKTLLGRVLVKELLTEKNSDVALIVNPMLSKIDLLREILFQLKADTIPKTKLQILHLLNNILYENHGKKKNTIIIVDEAQVINRKEVFEELRLLLNFQLNDKFLLTLILIGQPELQKKIDAIPQLKQRLALTYHLRGLDNTKVSEYIKHRLKVAGKSEDVFLAGSVEKISEYANGIPRKINNVCEFALLQAMFDKKTNIDEELTTKVLEDFS